MIVGRFVLCRRDVVEGFEETPVVEPVDPGQHRELDGVDAAPRPALANDFGLEEPDDAFRERVVVRVTDAPHRPLDSGLGQPLGIANREVLHASIAVVDQAVRARPRVERLLEGIECQVASQGARHAPADYRTREDVDHEGDVDEAHPRRDVREVGDPELVRTGGSEVALDEVGRLYPAAAVQAGRSGKVVIDMVVNRAGRPAVLKVKKSAGRELDEAALEAVSRWEYQPWRIEGKAQAASLSLCRRG